MVPTTISSMAVSDCECQTFDWSILLVASGILAWCLAQLLRGCSLLASCRCQSKIIGQPQPEGQTAGAPGANGQTCQKFGQPEEQSAGAPGANGQTCQTFGQPEGQAAGAPGASGQTSQTFDQPKGQTASQTPGCGCQTVRKTEKKVYITVQGKCYHMDPECQHIRNRNAVVEKVPCSVCVCEHAVFAKLWIRCKTPKVKSDKGWYKLMSDKLSWNKDAAWTVPVLLVSNFLLINPYLSFTDVWVCWWLK